jgi:hypothetical protein
MIYQLVKRDVSWKVAVGLALLGAFLGIWGSPGWPHVPVYWIYWIFILLMSVLSPAHKRCTAFEAALPITGRELFLARLMLSGISIWVPILAAMATILASTGPSSAGLAWFIDLGAIMSLAVIAIQSRRLQRFTAPAWWGAVIGILAVFSAGLAPYKMPARFVVLICAAAGSVLLLKCWLGVPESLQIGPVNAVRWLLGKVKLPFKLPPWMPVLRILFPKESMALFGVVLVFSMAADNGSSVLIGLVWLFGLWVQNMTKFGWLLALPISRFRLFFAIGIAPLVLYMLSSFTSLLESGLPARDTAVILAIVGVAGSLGLLNSELFYVCTRRRRLLFPISFVVLFGVDLHFRPPRSANGIRTDALGAWLSTALPGNVFVVAAIATLVIGPLLWLAYRAFCRLEPRLPVTSL